jgi:hypothetical protein
MSIVSTILDKKIKRPGFRKKSDISYKTPYPSPAPILDVLFVNLFLIKFILFCILTHYS